MVVGRMRAKRYGHEFFLGPFKECYLGYAADPEVRRDAASGGVVSAILIALLEQNEIDGAWVSRTVTRNGRVEFETMIATTREDILDCRTSIYSSFGLLKGITRLKEKKGRYAIVALPCQIKALNRLLQKDPELAKRIVCKIGLLCSHISHRSLLDKVLEMQGIDQQDIERFFFRKGHWRGETMIRMRNGSTVRFPFMYFGLYQNLYFRSARRCLSCLDHFAEESDISCGDAWLRELKKEPSKHSIFLARSERWAQFIYRLFAQKKLYGGPTKPENLIRAQWRALVYHKFNTSARSQLGCLFGFSIPYKGIYRPRLGDYIAAFCILFNVRLSWRNSYFKFLMTLPRPLLFAYVIFIKIWLSF